MLDNDADDGEEVEGAEAISMPGACVLGAPAGWRASAEVGSNEEGVPGDVCCGGVEEDSLSLVLRRLVPVVELAGMSSVRVEEDGRVEFERSAAVDAGWVPLGGSADDVADGVRRERVGCGLVCAVLLLVTLGLDDTVVGKETSVGVWVLLARIEVTLALLMPVGRAAAEVEFLVTREVGVGLEVVMMGIVLDKFEGLDKVAFKDVAFLPFGVCTNVLLNIGPMAEETEVDVVVTRLAVV